MDPVLNVKVKSRLIQVSATTAVAPNATTAMHSTPKSNFLFKFIKLLPFITVDMLVKADDPNGSHLTTVYRHLNIKEAVDEKAAMKMNLMVSDFVSTQTMVAMPREEAIKLV